MLPGDGIGPEMMGYVKEVYRYAGAPVDFEEIRFDPNAQSEEELAADSRVKNPPSKNQKTPQIGRASCRERV